jgi:hypothetical protein
MINMALKWHQKKKSNNIIVFIAFWWLPNVLFGSFDCDCTLWCSLLICKGIYIYIYNFQVISSPFRKF